MAFNKDSVGGTLIAAFIICLVCGIVVSTAAVSLRPMQEENHVLDRQTNILVAAGLYREGINVPEAFAEVERQYVELGTATLVEASEVPDDYDQRTPSESTRLSDEEDIASVRNLPKWGEVYLVRDEQDNIETIVLPVQGYGLWSTMYGFLSLEGDANTIAGLVFYDHGETPGLGAEIENKSWQALWEGKKLLSDNGDLNFEVIKGNVDDRTPNKDNKVDGLSGATLTSKGVSNMVRFWVGDKAYGPYLDSIRESGN